jgi:hypothetical protein
MRNKSVMAARQRSLGSDRSRPVGSRATTQPPTARWNASFNRTLADEWAYARLWKSERSRALALVRFLHRYNHHRHHTAIGGPPASRVNNLAGYNI